MICLLQPAFISCATALIIKGTTGCELIEQFSNSFRLNNTRGKQPWLFPPCVIYDSFSIQAAKAAKKPFKNSLVPSLFNSPLSSINV